MQNKPLSATRLTACVSTTRPLEVVPNNWLTQLIPLKICRKCQEAKADKDFHRNTRLPGGFEHHCKSCRAEGDNLRRLEKQQQVDTVTDKQCRNCGQTKPADCFQRNGGNCKKCKRLVEIEARQRRKRKAATADSSCNGVSPPPEQQTPQHCSSAHPICQHAAVCAFHAPRSAMYSTFSVVFCRTHDVQLGCLQITEHI